MPFLVANRWGAVGPPPRLTEADLSARASELLGAVISPVVPEVEVILV